MTRIPFARAAVTFEDAAPFLKKALDNGWLTSGPLCDQFAQGLREFLQAETVIPVSSCTAALQLALKACDFAAGAEVLVPANTFVATFETVELAGLKPVLCDIDPDTWNLDLHAIEKQITQKTKAVIAVPFAGNPLPMEKLRALCDAYHLKLILDNAHALEASYRGKKLHHYADYSCYSFYATKNLTTAEGGAIVCPPEQAERIRALSLHGMTRAAWKRYAGGSWRYDIVETGYKANLSDIHAALGLAQLPKIAEFHRRRVALAQRYRSALANLPLRMQQLAAGVSENDHAWHLFCISLLPEAPVSRDILCTALAAAGIGFSVHFIPLFEFSHTKRSYGFRAEDFPATCDYFAGALSLPLYPTLCDDEQEEIITVIRNTFRCI
ncbi:MAG: DegT/DnrJ/EryC1/StrS family aminotransferase [Turneriella sp.]|nr:DegT/DnrJ/EryC1/StrS family aminotransferase [Turneriella sp.]